MGVSSGDFRILIFSGFILQPPENFNLKSSNCAWFGFLKMAKTTPWKKRFCRRDAHIRERLCRFFLRRPTMGRRSATMGNRQDRDAQVGVRSSGRTRGLLAQRWFRFRRPKSFIRSESCWDKSRAPCRTDAGSIPRGWSVSQHFLSLPQGAERLHRLLYRTSLRRHDTTWSPSHLIRIWNSDLCWRKRTKEGNWSIACYFFIALQLNIKALGAFGFRGPCGCVPPVYPENAATSFAQPETVRLSLRRSFGYIELG